jgi:hypothetical protein
MNQHLDSLFSYATKELDRPISLELEAARSLRSTPTDENGWMNIEMNSFFLRVTSRLSTAMWIPEFREDKLVLESIHQFTKTLPFAAICATVLVGVFRNTACR